MTTSHESTEKKPNRDMSLELEQALCVEAVESGEFDTMSDSEWIAMCEQIAAKARKPGKKASEQPEAATN